VIVRLLNLLVIGALVLAAAYVYRIKFDSTLQAERLAKLRTEVRHERDKIAGLRAKWGELDNPARIEELAKRFLRLKPVAATQFDKLDHLPDQPPDYMRPGAKDPIGGMIENLEEPVAVTGSVGVPNAASSNTGAPAQ
jgi:cell division protein FtsL